MYVKYVFLYYAYRHFLHVSLAGICIRMTDSYSILSFFLFPFVYLWGKRITHITVQ